MRERRSTSGEVHEMPCGVGLARSELAAELRRCAAQARGTRRLGVVLAAAATLILFASAFFIFHSLHTHLAPPASGLNPALPEKSIAVLPFENVSRDSDSVFLVRGAYEDVLTKLAKITDLNVVRTGINVNAANVSRITAAHVF